MNVQLLVPPVVGGIIGYFTNYVAIKMLFRPRKAVYIGKWKVPFTPGLIPSKRDKLAASIAKVVKENLLTEETVRKRLNEEKVKISIEALVDKGLDRLLDSMPEYIEKMTFSIADRRLFEVLNITDVEKMIGKVVNYVYEKKTTLRDIFPEAILRKKEEIIGSLTKKLIEVAREKINSEEFLDLIADRIQKFMETSGKIPDVVIFRKPVKVISDTIAAKIVKTLNETVESPLFVEAAKSYISRTFDRFLEKEIVELVGKKYDRESLTRRLTAIVYENFNTPIRKLPFVRDKTYTLIAGWMRALIDKNRELLIENISLKLLELIEKELPVIMESMDIENLVAEKVNSLPIDEVEGIVLRLIDEELRYITLLGGILGFIIGAFQDVLFFVK
ncbi:DUF445 family protein [Desulfurobacterium sp.]|uniref:DUF445 domain-containing protein n=1 Tax=Desulfurobacterium sp. TaxID=2004706 RepID=UPI00262DCDE8|nr:DUF445 family protein [Desulfurobacterium sp.]